MKYLYDQVVWFMNPRNFVAFSLSLHWRSELAYQLKRRTLTSSSRVPLRHRVLFESHSLPKTAARIAHLQASLIIANVSICFRSISLSVTVLQTSKFSEVSFETMGTWPPLDLEVCIVDVPTLYALEVRVMRSQSSAQAVMVTGYSFSVAWYVFGSVLPGPPWDVYGIYCNYMFFFVCHYDVIAIFKLRMLSFGWKEVVCCCSCLAASTWATPHNTELIAMEGVRDAFEQTVGNSIRCSQLQMRTQVFQTREARKLFQQKFNTWASQHSQKPACNLDISF